MRRSWKMVLGVSLCTGVLLAGSQGLTSTSADGTLISNNIRSQQTDLNVLWEVQASGTNKMTTPSSAEAALFPMVGQVAYVPKNSATGRSPLYRLYNGSSDHMVSLTAGEGGYTTEAAIGYPWNAATKPAGTTAMFRGLNSSGDHALMSDHQQYTGYTVEGLGNAYSYPRFGSQVPLLSLTGSAMTVKSNLAAGGVIWELWWNGKQMIDNYDYGREIQASMSFQDSNALPTEGGDYVSNSNKNYMHGSPVASSANTITTTSKKQSTRAVPLEWNYTSFNGGLADVPVIYKDWKLGKDITLDDQGMDLGSGFNSLRAQIMRYDTVLDIPQTLYGANIEIPTAYLTSDLRRGFTFDATQSDINAGLSEKTVSDYTQLDSQTYHLQYSVNAGGVIYATDNLQYALGIYGSQPSLGGSATYFTLWKFGSFSSPFVTKWSAGNGWSTFNAGENRFTTYVIAGTLDDVRTAMRRMYLMGYR